MCNLIDWGDIQTGGVSGGRPEYMKMKDGVRYQVRPVGPVVEIYRFYNKVGGKNRSAVVEKDSAKEIFERLKEKDSRLRYPARRYACWVFDRTDGANKLKLLEASSSVFCNFRDWALDPENAEMVDGKLRARNVGGSQAPDWRITPHKKGNSDVLEYSVQPLKETILSQEEIDMLTETTKHEKCQLKTIFRPLSYDEIEQRLFDVNPNDAVAGDDPVEETVADQAPIRASAEAPVASSKAQAPSANSGKKMEEIPW